MRRLKSFRLSYCLVALAAALPMAGAQAAPQSYVYNAYVGNFSGNSVTVVDTQTDTVTGSIDTGNGSNPVGFAITPDGSTAYIVNSGSNSVSFYDAASGTITATVPVGNAPQGAALSPNGAVLYVCNSADNSLSFIDTATGSISATANKLPGCNTVSASPDGSKLLVTTPTNDVYFIELGTLTFGNTISFFGDSIQSTFSPDGARAYVAAVDDIEIIDVASETKIAEIDNFGQLDGIAVRPDNAETWVVNSLNQVLVVDNATNTLSAVISTSEDPTDVSFNADGSRAYVIAPEAHELTVYDTATKQIVDQVTIPDNGRSFGKFIAGAPPASAIASAVLPGGRSVQAGHTATIFASMINTSGSTLNNCGIALATDNGLNFSYQTTNPSTNALTGSPNTPVSIAGNNGLQTFVLSFEADSAVSFPDMPLIYGCDGTPPAAITTGVNTVDLTFAALPTADIIALAATTSGNGVVTVPFSQGGAAAFAVASVNAGATGTLTVSADTGDASLPISVSLCETNPSTGACLAPPSSTLSVNFTANATPTFSFFVSASGDVAFAPGTSRIFVRFNDAANASHGSTSVAVTTD